MNLDGLTIGEAKQIWQMFNTGQPEATSTHFFKVGKAYLIRTVTHITIGIVKEVGEKEILLSDASWIADTGRYHDALKEGSLGEVEPYVDDCGIGRGAIVDFTAWNHALPVVQK